MVVRNDVPVGGSEEWELVDRLPGWAEGVVKGVCGLLAVAVCVAEVPVPLWVVVCGRVACGVEVVPEWTGAEG